MPQPVSVAQPGCSSRSASFGWIRIRTGSRGRRAAAVSIAAIGEARLQRARDGIPCGPFELRKNAAILAGLATRLAAIPLIVNMLVAILTTKVPILISEGFWAMAHEARTDWSMLLGSIFLLVIGAGSWSIDARLAASVTPAMRDG